MTTPSPIVANGCTLTVTYSVGGQDSVNVLGGYFTESPGLVDTTEVNRWLNAWWTAFRPTLPGAVIVTGAMFRDLTESPSPAIEVGAPSTPAGGDSGSLAVAAAGAIINWRSAFAGRSGRGRTFLPGIGEVDVASNGRSLESAMVTRLNTAIGLYLSAMETGDGNIVPAVVSRRLGVARQITTGSPGPVVGIQRRRMR